MPAMNDPALSPDPEPGRRVKLFNDAILGAVELHTPALSLLDTPHAQRLRELKQLGASALLFPSASHCRLEHSIGVAATGAAWVDALLSYPRRHGLRAGDGDGSGGGGALFDTRREAEEARDLVQLAGLAHDLGHGPYSHLFDSKVLRRGLLSGHSPDTVPAMRHEWRSVMMLEDAVEQCGLDIERGVVRAAAELVDVRRRGSGGGGGGGDGAVIPPWMMGLVANDDGAPDADRLDYLARDSRYLNMPCSVDARRIMATSKVCGGGRVVGWPVKEAFALMDVYHTRYKLHKMAYRHRVSVGIDALLTDALLAADSHLHFTASIHDPSAFLALDDTIFHRIQFSTEAALAPARSLITRLRRRQLYPLCGELLCTPPTPAAPGAAPVQRRPTAADVAAHQSPKGGVDLRPEDIVVSPAVLSYAMGAVNPVERIPFWEAGGGGDGADVLLGEGGVKRVSRLVGVGACHEEVIRVYARRQGADVAASVRTAFRRCVDAWGLGEVTM